MAEIRRFGLGNQLDIEQLLLEAQNRWLRPAEICEILRNYERFRIAPEPANMPPSGSLFLFDRKVLRYFRKDGHNWRKKKDGKTVKEAHERLKAGSVDVLHCYYAHGQENEKFQRRSYWMLEEHLSHIVLVHYREVKGDKTSYNRRETEETVPVAQSEEIASNSQTENSLSSSFHPNSYQLPSQTTDTTSLNSAQASEYEDAESAYSHQASSGFHSFLGLQQTLMDAGPSTPYFPASFSNGEQEKLPAIPAIDFIPLAQEDRAKDGNGTGLTYEPGKPLGFSSWEDVFEHFTAGTQSQPSLSLMQPHSIGVTPKGEHETPDHSDDFSKKKEFRSHLRGEEEWQASESNFAYLSNWNMDQKLQLDLLHDTRTRLQNQEVGHTSSDNFFESSDTLLDGQSDRQRKLSDTDSGSFLKLESESNLTMEGKPSYSSAAAARHLLDGGLSEGLKKNDSFSRWMSKELEDVDETHMQSSSGANWDTIENENGVDDSGIGSQGHLDTYLLGPSISQDQLFSIIDFSPNWAYAGSETKVLIMGKFLKSQQNFENPKWSCMFGEVEVPAEVITDGVLRCYTPPLHEAGRIPFYVTCSNRLACSEIREFEYRDNWVRDVDIPDMQSASSSETMLCMRFGKLLSTGSSSSTSVGEKSPLGSQISYLLKEDDEWFQMLESTSGYEFPSGKVKEQLLQKLLKEKLHAWLLQKECEGGKGASVLDEGGQGVLHFAAALGYDWAIEPTILAGVSVDFRDMNGWTALHWAASWGRERTVASLISLGAAPGLLTHPAPQHPPKTPADLASGNGHKGIAGYLAESSLSAHLNFLNLKDSKAADGVLEHSGVKAVQTVSERSATPSSDGDLPDGLSMKDSLAAVCNATQAAARIYQVFRVQSFQKKQFKEYGNDKFGMSDEQTLSLIAVKSQKSGQHDEPVNAAAIRIQNKFRSWKGRKDYLIIRERIVKIQAHVRGHQVRKKYTKILWSVGILEKVILRWRRKGSGLRGYKREAIDGPCTQIESTKDDDDDFLKDGKKQTEARLQKALARVKSMVQYPEARDQYRRLLNAVEEIQETKVIYNTTVDNSGVTTDFDDDLIDIDTLLGDDTLMSTES